VTEQLGLFGGEPSPSPGRRKRQQREATEDGESARVVREEELAEHYLTDEYYLGSFCKGCGRPTGRHGDDIERCAECAPEEPCMLGHSAAYICPACADCGDTDGCGFLHRQVCKGRIPLRACRQCGKLKTHGGWSHSTYWFCLECKPLGVRDAT